MQSGRRSCSNRSSSSSAVTEVFEGERRFNLSVRLAQDGDVLASSPQNQEWFGLYKLPFHRNAESTIYQKIEGFWPWALALFALLLLGFAHALESRAKRK